MTDLPLGHVASTPKYNPRLNLGKMPPTDVSISSYRMVPIQSFTTGINPVVFQIDPQTDFVDLSRSYFEVELQLKKANGDALVAAQNLFPANNFAHTLWRQIIVKLNNTLMTPSIDTYHYKAYLETLTNFDRDDGETVLRPQGWYNGIDCPAALTANLCDTAANNGLGHADLQAVSKAQQETVFAMRKEIASYANVTKILRFKPNLEVFYLNKLLVPGIQIDIQMYFNPPSVFMNGIGLAARMDERDVKVRFYLCQVRLNPSTYLELSNDYPARYPTVRGEIRTYTMTNTRQYFECLNVFQGRVPNRVIVGMVLSAAFTGNVINSPFAFQQFNLTSIKQRISGEEYPYETLELNHDNGEKDMRGYFRFLQGTGALCKLKGNMVRDEEWGHDKNCTLFVFDNAANGCLDSPVLNPKQSGELSLNLTFGALPGANITIIVYGEFENMMEITKNKAVIYDIYD